MRSIFNFLKAAEQRVFNANMNLPIHLTSIEHILTCSCSCLCLCLHYDAFSLWNFLISVCDAFFLSFFYSLFCLLMATAQNHSCLLSKYICSLAEICVWQTTDVTNHKKKINKAYVCIYKVPCTTCMCKQHHPYTIEPS